MREAGTREEDEEDPSEAVEEITGEARDEINGSLCIKVVVRLTGIPFTGRTLDISQAESSYGLRKLRLVRRNWI